VKNITLISQYFYPEMISTGHILTELVLELAKKDIKWSIICAQPTYYSRERVPSRMTHMGLDIIRTGNTQYDKNTLKGKVVNSVSFFLQALAISLKRNGASAFLTVTNPPFLGIAGPVIRMAKGVPFVLIIHDLYPNIAISMGHLSPKSVITVFWNLLNSWIFREASFIVVLGRDMQALLKGELDPQHSHKVVYIPNWADPSLIYPVEQKNNPFIKQLGLQGKFVVEYSGNMGLTHDVETIVEAARCLMNENYIHFLMIGGGGKLGEIKRMARTYHLQNIRFVPYQPRENLRDSLCAAHISLVSLERGAEGLSVPSKLYGIMASGRPIVANVPEDSEVAITIKEFNCGIVTPPKDALAMVKAINWLKSNEAERKAMGERAYKAFKENFTVQRCAEQYYQLIQQISVG
jgi:glycosyltransferase involved in cell wall biosynthesis